MTGYSKLASFMTEKHHPILRKYQHLAVRDLLYLQAELGDLDSKYQAVAKKDATEEDERQYYDRDWFHLETSQRRGFGGEQWALAIDIRVKLREYHDALLQYSKVASLRQPKERERSILYDWTRSSTMGGGGFLGQDLSGFKHPSVYDAKFRKDLAIFSDSHGEDDLFTQCAQ